MPSEELMDFLRQHIENVFPGSMVNKCKEESCSLNLEGIPHRIIVKGEKACKDKICDCIIVTGGSEGIGLCIVELKSRRVHPTDIPEKLGNGAKIAFEILRKCDIRSPDPLFLVLRKSTNSSEHEIISKKRVHFNGKEHPIQIKRCGCSLCDLLQS